MDIGLGIITIVILIFSAILHEIAHGYVAERLGDPTARLMGRLTLNPKPHIDLVMSVIIPLLLILGGSPVIIGGAKPVPVDPFNLREPKKDMAIVSLAGPMTNFLIAFSVALIYNLVSPFISNSLVYWIIWQTVWLNLLLGLFNLIPIPPLDGSKILNLFLSDKWSKTYMSLGSFGIFIVFFLLMPFSPIPLSTWLTSTLLALMNLLGMGII